MRLLALALPFVCLSLQACGDDQTTKPTDTALDTTAAETQAETAQADTQETSETAAPAKVDAACAEQGYTDCFHNGDCAAAERCEDMSSSALEIPCCVVGTRGTGEAGVACTTENDCAAALCIQANDGPSLCSKVCMTDADCPAAAAKCAVIGACVPAE